MVLKKPTGCLKNTKERRETRKERGASGAYRTRERKRERDKEKKNNILGFS